MITDDELMLLIETRIALTAIAPSYRELAEMSGMRSHKTLGEAIDRLVASGRLRRLPKRARALDVARTGPLRAFRVSYDHAGDAVLTPIAPGAVGRRTA